MDSTSKQRKGYHSARVQFHFVLDERNFQILQMTVFWDYSKQKKKKGTERVFPQPYNTR